MWLHCEKPSVRYTVCQKNGIRVSLSLANRDRLVGGCDAFTLLIVVVCVS